MWRVDAAANRSAPKYPAYVQLARIAWSVGAWLIRLSPRPFFAWRRAVLRAFGAQVGREVHIYPSTRIFMPWNLTLKDYCALGDDVYVYALGHVTIGHSATVSYRSHLCAGTHDLNDPALPLLKPPIVIGDNAWIGTEAFIGPGVTIGDGAVVGARAVVVGDVRPLCIVAGNPARQIGIRRYDAPIDTSHP